MRRSVESSQSEAVSIHGVQGTARGCSPPQLQPSLTVSPLCLLHLSLPLCLFVRLELPLLHPQPLGVSSVCTSYWKTFSDKYSFTPPLLTRLPDPSPTAYCVCLNASHFSENSTGLLMGSQPLLPPLNSSACSGFFLSYVLSHSSLSSFHKSSFPFLSPLCHSFFPPILILLFSFLFPLFSCILFFSILLILLSPGYSSLFSPFLTPFLSFLVYHIFCFSSASIYLLSSFLVCALLFPLLSSPLWTSVYS